MPNSVASLWGHVRSWFSEEATQVTLAFLPDPGGDPVAANDGYLRLWLAEGFLAQQRDWAAQQFPALHGGALLTFLGGQSAFTTFSRPPEAWKVPGAQLDFPLTPLLPFTGGTVEIEAALFRASEDGPLGTAVTLLGELMSLVGPPLATAAQIAGKISQGIDTVVTATGSTPVLGLHWTMVSAGGGGHELRPGHLVLLSSPPAALPGIPAVRDGRLHLLVDGRPTLPTGLDYLVVRVECRVERDDWRLPELDELIRAAGEAAIRGQAQIFQDRRTEALARAWSCADLVPPDRMRVALLVRDELARMQELGAVPGPAYSLSERSGALADRQDPQLQNLTLQSLLA